MASTAFVVTLGAAAFIFFWHVFIVMQITPQAADFLASEKTQTTEPQPNQSDKRTAAMRHYEAANMALDDLRGNYASHDKADKYRLAFLAKEHLKIVHQEYEDTDTDTEREIKDAIERISSFMDGWET